MWDIPISDNNEALNKWRGSYSVNECRYKRHRWQRWEGLMTEWSPRQWLSDGELPIEIKCWWRGSACSNWYNDVSDMPFHTDSTNIAALLSLLLLSAILKTQCTTHWRHSLVLHGMLIRISVENSWKTNDHAHVIIMILPSSGGGGEGEGEEGGEIYNFTIQRYRSHWSTVQTSTMNHVYL